MSKKMLLDKNVPLTGSEMVPVTLENPRAVQRGSTRRVVPSATRNLFEKRFLDLQKLLFKFAFLCVSSRLNIN